MATEQVNMNRNPEGKGGFGDHPELINAGGRPKNSLKSYVAKKLAEMSDEDKDAFLKSISASEQWKMAEGNPHATTDVTSGGKELPVPIIQLNVPRDNGNEENSITE